MYLHPKVFDGLAHAPYFVFLRSPISERDWVTALGLDEYELVVSGSESFEHAWIGRVGDWLHFADSWTYHFWHRHDRPMVLRRCAAMGELFAFRVRDTDESYEFEHWRQGVQVRRYEVASPRYTDQSVNEDHGAPLEAERSLTLPGAPVEPGPVLARSLGIEFSAAQEALRAYAPRW